MLEVCESRERTFLQLSGKDRSVAGESRDVLESALRGVTKGGKRNA